MEVLAAAEEHRGFDLIAVAQEFARLTYFGVEIVIINVGSQADLFNLCLLLALTGLAFFPTFLVLELAVVHEPSDRRVGIWRNFDQIKAFVARGLQRLLRWDDAELVSFFVNEAHLAYTYTLVHAHRFGAYQVPLVFCGQKDRQLR